LKLDESQRKCLESLFNTAYSVVKAGKPFSDYELICEIQVKNGLDLGEKSSSSLNQCLTHNKCSQGFQYFSNLPVPHYLQAVLFIKI
jgi:hypothetical protein